MDALELLLNRHSFNQLDFPGPSGTQLQIILNAGLRTPDHGGLKPWRYMLYQGDGLKILAKIFEDAAFHSGKAEKDLKKAASAPFRAPMIIAIVASLKTCEKVPEIEQIMSSGCAVMAMQMAAQAQGFNGIWRTGWFAYDSHIKAKMGLDRYEKIVGFLYLGTPKTKVKKIRHLNISDFLITIES